MKKGKQDLKEGDKKDEGQGSPMDEDSDDVEEVSFVYMFLARDLHSPLCHLLHSIPTPCLTAAAHQW